MARISKPHTEEKLIRLKKYLEGYVVATKNAKERYFIDALAGDGQCEIKKTGSSKSQIFDGSALIAMKIDNPSFTKCFFIEIEKQKVATLSKLLEDFPPNRYKIKEGDCNAVIDEILSETPQQAPCFAFLDPEGFEVNWRTIEKIANYKKSPNRKIELLILFPYYMAITRILPYDRKKYNEKTATAALNGVLPDDSWRDIYEKRLKGQLNLRQMKERMLAIYISGLSRLGYRKDLIYWKLIKSAIDRPLYYLIFATDHPAGAKIMKYVFGKDWKGDQISFLDKLT